MRAIDLFAGWGGFTLGATKAGVDVVWAADHWKLAVEAHRQNHPDTKHECQDLNQCDFSQVPDYEILLASPACQGHSTASQPKRRSFHDDLRATAWAVISCADRTNPEIVIVENVPSFKRWRLYSAWLDALELLGYCVHEVKSTASGHGVPQRRKRLFIVATRSGTPPPARAGPRTRVRSVRPVGRRGMATRVGSDSERSPKGRCRSSSARRPVLDPARHRPQGRRAQRADPDNHDGRPVGCGRPRHVSPPDGPGERSSHGFPRFILLASRSHTNRHHPGNRKRGLPATGRRDH